MSLLSERKYFGKLSEDDLNKFRSSLREIHPHAVVFKSREEQESELETCIQGLSLTVAATPAPPTSTDGLADKLSAASIQKSND